MKIEEALNYFGCVSEHKEFDTYLESLSIPERPIFIENPMEWVNRKDEGFIFMFTARPGYEERYGKSRGEGNMVFEGIRLYAKQNTDGFLEYEGSLPFKLLFKQKIDEVKNILGTPNIDDEAPEEESRLCIWRKISMNGGFIELSIVFLPNSGSITFITLAPVELRFK
jgi:hypothetical protein